MILDNISTQGIFLIVVISLGLLYIFNKILLFLLTRVVDSKQLPADLFNAIKVLTRFALAMVWIYITIVVLNLAESTVIGLSVILGSVLSFASIYTIQNFVSGLYILTTEPFSVNDLVRIGASEGVVIEISLNYTRLLNFDGMVESIPNKKILGSSIINYDQPITSTSKSENFIDSIKQQFDDTEVTKYTFVWGTPLIDYRNIIDRLDSICEEYQDIFGYRPTYLPYTINHRFEFSFILKADDPMTILRHKTDFLDKISLQFH
ncbi:MAG: mechanosensitive ion channel domain-containing protein [Candidatus Kariarchaeaceae archaeon]|jgi:hypothetical protein